MEELAVKQAEEIADFLQRTVNRNKARKEKEQATITATSSVPSTTRESPAKDEPAFKFQNTLKKMKAEG